ncbi:hypothetical protein [Micromonospora sp. NBRC 101691]|uniref:hypothetical protein n=1 Tax=Micromonospora sp. NBRC 101691 TaxID=3032198 RepID=UPI00249FB1E4|nr:hypothetical protein [Micromonospora sp. NBRC 101691]GLY24668.1 hypothetical protein Misp04_44000 [Micromonospora sp. NBRC 101691]
MTLGWLRAPNEAVPSFAPPPVYDPAGGNAYANGLLDLLAWCVTAAGVAGLIIVGIMMTIQFNRGVPGDESDHFRGLTIVLLACVLGAAAGPLVTYFGDLGL